MEIELIEELGRRNRITALKYGIKKEVPTELLVSL